MRCVIIVLAAWLAAPALLAQGRRQHAVESAATVRPVAIPQTPGLNGLGRFVIGQPLAGILEPLQAEWGTTVRVVRSVDEVQAEQGRPLILELKDADGDPQYQLLRHCAEARVFVLPYCPLAAPAPAGTTGMLLRGLYLIFYQDRLTRIWYHDPALITAAFRSEAYGFGAGVRKYTESQEQAPCNSALSNIPRIVTVTRRWQNGDVEAGSYQTREYCAKYRQDSFVLKSRRLDAELTHCLGLAASRP